MGRIPCCEKDNVKRGQWTPEEDNKLSSYIALHGTRNWRLIPKNAGLQRCGKSCRLRWTNYLRPDLKHGEFSESEEQTIVKLHSVVGNRWSLIAAQLPGRTDNDVKNHWNTKLKKKLSGMGIDPVTHKPFSHLMAEIATTLASPQVAHLAEAALGCFKDEMLHLLTKKRIDFQLQREPNSSGYEASPPPVTNSLALCVPGKPEEEDISIHKNKLGIPRTMQEPEIPLADKPWSVCSNEDTSDGFAGLCNTLPTLGSGSQYGASSYGNEGDTSPWNQSMYTGSTCTGGDQKGVILGKEDEEDEEVAVGGKHGAPRSGSLFNPDCALWDLSEDF